MRRYSILLWPLIATFAAAEERPFTAQVNQQVLSHERTWQEGDSFRSTSTMPNSLELVLNVGSWHLHVFPTDDTVPLQIGYDVLEGLELGVACAVDESVSADDRDRREAVEAGIFAVKAFVAPGATFELSLAAGASRSARKATEPASGAVERTRTDDRYAAVGLGLAKPLVSDLAWLATVSFERRTHDDASTAVISPLGVRVEL